MVEIPSYRHLLGKLSLSKANELVFGKPGEEEFGLRTRRGQYTRLDQPNHAMRKAEDPDKLARARNAWLPHLEKQTPGEGAHSPAVTADAVTALLRLMQRHGARLPTVHEMAAVLAFHHGLEKNNLEPQIRSMFREERRMRKRAAKKRAVTERKRWEGVTDGLLRAVQFDLPARIEKAMFENPVIMNQAEIAQKLSLSHNDAAYRSINYAMQLLEQANLVRKELPASRQKGGNLACWAHNEHADLPVKHENVPLYILKQIHSGGGEAIKTRDLHKPGKKIPGNPDAPYNAVNVYKQLRFLQENGLVERGVRAERINGRTLKTAWVKLTPLGKEIMDEFQANEGKSFEKLRNCLLIRMHSLSDTGHEI